MYCRTLSPTLFVCHLAVEPHHIAHTVWLEKEAAIMSSRKLLRLFSGNKQSKKVFH